MLLCSPPIPVARLRPCGLLLAASPDCGPEQLPRSRASPGALRCSVNPLPGPVTTSPLRLVAAPTRILLLALWLLQAPTPFVLTTLAQYATTMKGRYGRYPSRQSLHKRMIDFAKGVCQCSTAHSLHSTAWVHLADEPTPDWFATDSDWLHASDARLPPQMRTSWPGFPL